MNTLQIIKRFNYSQLWQLILLSIKYPLYVYPTLKATSKSFLDAKREFPETHGKKGKGNAFRHAYWNTMICFECYKWKKDRRRIVAWAKLITDKHEQLSPNTPLDRRMDLHNNKIGVNFFIQSSFTSHDEILDRLKHKLKTAQQIKTIDDVKKYPLELVYISEYDTV